MTAVGAALVLVHSPIVGADTWVPVAEVLRRRGRDVVVPELARGPGWQAHVGAVVDAVSGAVAAEAGVVVLGHSGAGQLMGHVAEGLAESGVRTVGHVLVDAGLPTGGTSRLDQLRQEDAVFADELEAGLAARRPFPAWDEAQLRPLVPDDDRRRLLLAGLRPMPARYWTEPIPPATSWPSAPVGVVLLSRGYEATATAAAANGWPVRVVDGDNHFQILAAPDLVAAAIEDVLAALDGS